MHTFLPYKSFETTARVLDRNTLAKQPMLVLRVAQALTGEKAWSNHPTTKMWRGHANSLLRYQEALCREWEARGGVDHYLDDTRDILEGAEDTEDPPWLGLKKLHSSHRATLLRKDYIWYLKYKWPEKPREGLWYPHG